MPVPDFQTLMLPVLRLSAVEIGARDLVDAVANEFGLSPEERQELLPSGNQSKLLNRVSWAKVYLGKAGLLQKTERGKYAVTPLGNEVLASNIDRVDTKYLTRFPTFKVFKHVRSKVQPKIDANDNSEPVLTVLAPEESIRAARDEIEAALADDLIEVVLAKNPAFFERLIVQLVVKMGYGGSLTDAGRALGRGGDGGVDGVINEDALGLDRVYVQAKRYKLDNKVGPGAIRDFFGALDAFRANKGLFVTTSTFTPDATETAANLSKRIVLVDGARLAGLMIRYEVGVRVIETIPIKKIDEDFFDEA